MTMSPGLGLGFKVRALYMHGIGLVHGMGLGFRVRAYLGIGFRARDRVIAWDRLRVWEG